MPPKKPEGGTSLVKPTASARFLGVWLDRKLNWKAHQRAVERKLKTQSYALSRITAKTWGLGLAKAREVYTKCIRSALAYGASSFHTPTKRGGKPATSTKALRKAQNKSLRIVAGAFKATPIRNLETETWVPPLDLYLNKRLADFEARLKQPALNDGQGGKKTPGSIVHTACIKIHQRFNPRKKKRRRGRLRAFGPQRPTAVEEAANTIADWTGGTTDTDKVVEEAWKERWLKDRDGRATTRTADDPNHQQETLFNDKTLKRHEGLSRAESSLLVQIRTKAIGLRDFLFERGVREILTPYCECGEGRETAEHLVMWCLAPPLTRRWKRAEVRTQRDFYSTLQGTSPAAARLTRRILGWLMDSGRLPMYGLARRLELESVV